MMFAHIHSTKEKLYGLFNLHVQLDFTIGVMVKLIKISISQQELKNWKRNCAENKDASHASMKI